MSTYSEKLKDPRWQKRRLKVMEYAHWRCQICGGKDNTLHCHHSYYTKGKEPWQYPDGSIICICEGCHEKIHPEKVKRAPAAPEEKAPTFAEICRARREGQPATQEPAKRRFDFLRETEKQEEQPLPEKEALSRFAAMRAMLEDIG